MSDEDLHSIIYFCLNNPTHSFKHVVFLCSSLQLESRSSNTTEVRLLRFLEARNGRKDGDMLLLDEQVASPTFFSYLCRLLILHTMMSDVWFILDSSQFTLIHRTINSSRGHTFRKRLSEGSVFSLSKAIVLRIT